MIFFYVDEGGDPNPHHEPLLEGETPLFCLTAVAVHSSKWRDLDRALLGLKRTYFQPQMQAFVAAQLDRRPEHYEVKGNSLFKPSSARNRRNRVFASKILDLARAFDVRVFSAVWRKDAKNPTDSLSMYTHSLQILAERFHHHCTHLGESAVIVADSRVRHLDLKVAAGHLSFLFGHPVGRGYTRLVEAPMFVDSSLSAGVQFADMLGSCIYGYYYNKRCSGIPGLFNGLNPLSLKDHMANPAGPWTTKTPGRDYSHCASYWTALDALQFKRAGTPPRPGAPVPGFYGFREVT